MLCMLYKAYIIPRLTKNNRQDSPLLSLAFCHSTHYWNKLSSAHYKDEVMSCEAVLGLISQVNQECIAHLRHIPNPTKSGGLCTKCIAFCIFHQLKRKMCSFGLIIKSSIKCFTCWVIACRGYKIIHKDNRKYLLIFW